jgi:sugar phosphate permease
MMSARRITGRDRLASGGLALATLGLVMLARLDEASTVGEIIACLVLTGLGQGMFQSPNARALMNASPPSEQGETSSLYATARVVGQSLSVAFAGTIFAALGGASAGRALVLATTDTASAGVVALQHAFVSGFRGRSSSVLRSRLSASSWRWSAVTNAPNIES